MIELASFAQFLASFENTKLFHEAFTVQVAAALRSAGINPSGLTTTWAPVEGVECVIRT